MTKFWCALVLCLGIGALSCSKDETPPAPPKTAPELLAEGWQGFSGHNYQLAIDRFTAALQLDPTLVDAYNGSGWANAKRDSLNASSLAFNAGLALDTGNLPMKAGLAFVLNAQRSVADHYQQSIDRANSVLLADSGWTFSRDTSVNSRDLHILLAEDYFAMADYATSLAEVKKLASFDADITTVAGQTQLAAEIEYLRSVN